MSQTFNIHDHRWAPSDFAYYHFVRAKLPVYRFELQVWRHVHT